MQGLWLDAGGYSSRGHKIHLAMAGSSNLSIIAAPAGVASTHGRSHAYTLGRDKGIDGLHLAAVGGTDEWERASMSGLSWISCKC